MIFFPPILINFSGNVKFAYKIARNTTKNKRRLLDVISVGWKGGSRSATIKNPFFTKKNPSPHRYIGCKVFRLIFANTIKNKNVTTLD